MSKKLHVLFACSFVCAAVLSAEAVGADAISPQESERILTGIFNKYIPVYTQYRGVESTSRSVIREYDARTRALKSTMEVIANRKDYFYDPPEIKVLSYRKDGRNQDPADYRAWEMKPGYPVFDPRGTDHYTLKIVERKMIGNRECFRIVVSPKQATARHFKGDIYCATDTLDIVRTDGGAGELVFPIKQFRAVFGYRQVNNVSMVQSGMIEMMVDLPVIYPHALILTATTVMESRLIE